MALDPSDDKVLEVWQSNLRSLKNSQPVLEPEQLQKLRILAKYEQLSIQHPPLPGQNIAEESETDVYKPIRNEILIQDRLSSLTEKLKRTLKDLIEIKASEYTKFSSYSTEEEYLGDQLKELKSRTKQLTSHLKIVICDYLLHEQFPQLEPFEEQILKLLEILLNNAVKSTSTGKHIWLLIDQRDDEFVRFLILNGLVVVEETNTNRIRLAMDI